MKKVLAKKSFQVNMHFGKKEMSACGRLGIVFAPNLNKLVRKIKKEFDLKLEQIELTFQSEGKEYIPHVADIVNVSDPPDPNSAWSHAFTGTVKAVNEVEGYATVTDLDENAFDIDFIYLTKDESEE